MPRDLCDALRAKVEEQVDRTLHLMSLLPVGRLDSDPQLLGHLVDCLAGFCAVFHAADRQRLAHFQELRSIPVNDDCSAEEASRRIRLLAGAINEAFATLDDA